LWWAKPQRKAQSPDKGMINNITITNIKINMAIHKNTLPLLLTAFTLFSLIACKQPTSLTESEKKVIIDNVFNTLNNYYNDVRKSGLNAEFNYLDSSTEFFWVPPGYSISISYDSVAAILKQTSSKYKLIDNRFDTLLIIPLNKELATYTGRLHSAMTDTSGIVLNFSLVETGILIKRPGGWKLLNGQTSILNQ
jgi:hypothetical protein